MINGPDYYTATNMAYVTLCSLRIAELPIVMFQVIKSFPALRLISYSEVCDRCGITWGECMGTNVSERGYIHREGDRAVIFYNDRVDPEIIRFTIAHELGHYILGHTCDCIATDREANCFARNFLCPVPVTECFDLTDVNECCDVFDITPPAAEVVLDKKRLDHRNTDAQLYQTTAQLLGLPFLTKEEQLRRRPARAMRAFADYTFGWSGGVGNFQTLPERLAL